MHAIISLDGECVSVEESDLMAYILFIFLMKGQDLKERIQQLEQDVDDYLSTCELIFLQQQPSSVTLPDTPDAGYSPEICSQEEGEEQDNQPDEEAFSLTQKKHSRKAPCFVFVRMLLLICCLFVF